MLVLINQPYISKATKSALNRCPSAEQLEVEVSPGEPNPLWVRRSIF
jgi:hypothetical protein